MVVLSNYPTSLPCCCCTIHLVFQSTTDKHYKFKVQMCTTKCCRRGFPTVTILCPCGRSSQKTRPNSAAIWMMLGSVCQREYPVQTANALGIVRALLNDAAANRDNFQQLGPLAVWMCACVVCVSECPYMCVCLCACVCEINIACIAALPLSLLSLGSGRTSTSALFIQYTCLYK